MARIIRKPTLSMRGTPVDFGALQAQNAHQPTLGNTRTNVRGDLLRDNGQVLKTQEEIEAEWARKKALQERVSQAANIKADQVVMPKKPNANSAVTPDVEFPTIGELVDKGAIPTTKRKIVDRD